MNSDNFTLNLKANPSGTYLYARLHEVEEKELAAIFGPPSYGIEEEKGYLNQYIFVGPDGEVVTLYDRWYAWRVGATTDLFGERFLNWIKTKLAASKTAATVGA